jgi:hypothetical protein
MTDRVDEELELLRSVYPDLEYKTEGGHWVRLPSYEVPDGWSQQEVEVAFQIPDEAGQQPYAFLVRPPLTLANGDAPDRYTTPATTPWGEDWGQFSWSPLTPWFPDANIREGDNMLTFVRSFMDRFLERA